MRMRTIRSWDDSWTATGAAQKEPEIEHFFGKKQNAGNSIVYRRLMLVCVACDPAAGERYPNDILEANRTGAIESVVTRQTGQVAGWAPKKLKL